MLVRNLTSFGMSTSVCSIRSTIQSIWRVMYGKTRWIWLTKCVRKPSVKEKKNEFARTIIQELGVKPVIDAQEEIRRSIDFLKDIWESIPSLKTFVLGISGGQDSTLAGRLAQLAMEELRAETGMIATNLSLSACLMECKLMKQMLKSPSLHPAWCQFSGQYQGFCWYHDSCSRSDR